MSVTVRKSRFPARKRCPKCHKSKNVKAEFGFRMMKNPAEPKKPVKRVQSYCRRCRAHS